MNTQGLERRSKGGVGHQLGFSLLEVMIAGVVTVLGLGGTAALLVISLAQTSSARDRAIAGSLAGEAGALVRLVESADSFLAPPPASYPSCTNGAACTPAQFAAAAHGRWHERVRARLPGGAGVVCRDSTPADGQAGEPACDGAPPLVAKLFWRDLHDGPQRLHRVIPER